MLLMTKEEIDEMRRVVTEMGEYGAYTPAIVLRLLDEIEARDTEIAKLRALILDNGNAELDNEKLN